MQFEYEKTLFLPINAFHFYGIDENENIFTQLLLQIVGNKSMPTN